MATIQSAVPPNSTNSLFLCQRCQKVVYLDTSLYGDIDAVNIGVLTDTGDTHNKYVSYIIIYREGKYSY